MKAFPDHSALLLVDLQNDFLHPRGAYARAGVLCDAIAALPARLSPVVQSARAHDVPVIATLFTLVPDARGEPLLSPHLRRLRPFLSRGDFAPGGFGQELVGELRPAHFEVEKIAYSAFYMSRLSWLLRRCNIETLVLAGITSNGGVASTARDAHVRDFRCVLLSDGCAAFSEGAQQAALQDLGTFCTLSTCSEARAAFAASRAASETAGGNAP